MKVHRNTTKAGPARLTGPQFLHVVDNSKPPKHWQAGPAEATAAPGVGAVMVIVVVAEIVLMILLDATHLARHSKMLQRHISDLKQ